MKRRKAISTLLWAVGASIALPSVLLESCKPDSKARESLTAEDIPLLDEIGETIIPATASSPGAKAARIGEFMTVYIADCYKKDTQKIVAEGLGKLENAAKAKYGNSFMKLTDVQKHDLLADIDKEAKDYRKARKKEDPDHYFSIIKETTLFGYFTSEIGAKQGLRYIQTPGRYDGDLPYKKGDKCWAM